MFEDSVPLAIDPERALDRAKSVLSATGLQIEKSGRGELSIKGPGLRSTNQNSLLAITDGRLTAGGGTLDLKADLGGLLFLQRFIRFFPPALCLFLFVVLGGTYYFAGMFAKSPHQIWTVIGVTGGQAVLWLFIGPLMSRAMSTRIKADIHRALSSLAVD
ncbi:hypothetical protein LLG95_04845 [bacterium]|nr:hypothetical protein [bacterium]